MQNCWKHSVSRSIKRKRQDGLLLRVSEQGGFFRYDLHTENGEVTVRTSSLTWNGTDTKVEMLNEFQASVWEYTEYGYLFIAQFRPQGYDGESVHMAVRVKPLEEKCREYNRKYIEPIGYGYNNMFLTKWDEADYRELDFYDLYEKLYPIKYGMPFGTDGDIYGDIYEIPREDFETLIQSYFPVDSQTLQEKTEYLPNQEAYRYRMRGLEDSCMPNYPQPEVTGYQEEADGSVTLTVNAVWEWENKAPAFIHEVRIRPLEDGGVQYLSNHILMWDEDVEEKWYTDRLTEEIQ